MTGGQFYEMLYGRESVNCKLFQVINHASHPFLDVVMPVITQLGGSRLVYLYAALLAMLCLLNRKALPARYLVVFLAATLVGLGVESLLKDFFRVPRPIVAMGVENVRTLGYVSRSFSLPSGHAVFSFMTAFVLGYGRSWRWKAPLLGFALLVAWSRVYVGAHYPLDVVGGALVGVASGWFVWRCYGFGERFVAYRRENTR